MGETVVSANGADSLRQALIKAKPGTIVELAPGHYGELRISVPYGDPWGAFDGEVTIRSADPDKPATFDGVYMNKVKNLTFDGLLFKKTEDGNLIEMRENADITIRNSVVEGKAVNGVPEGNGILVRSSEGITLENNELKVWDRSTVIQHSSDIVARGNELHTIRGDGFVFIAVQDVLVEGNHFHDFMTREHLTDHRDMIQFWTSNQTTPSTDVVIRDNIMNSGAGAQTQTIFMRNERVDRGQAGEEMFYRNITIEDNLIYNGHLHGITVGETFGLTIRNNTLLHNADSSIGGGVSRPRINVAEDSRDVVITDNIAAGVPKPAHSSWKVANNLLVQDERADKPNHYSDLFINAMTGGGEADLAALQALPGGSAGNYGAPVTRYDASPDNLTAIIRPEGERDGVFAFDGTYSANASGRLGEGNATFRWDMDDGTVLRGAEVEHDFAPGRYTVELTVTDRAGKSDTALTEVYVAAPVRLDLDVTSKGLVDRSSYGAEPLPSVKVVQDGGRYGARLTDSTRFELEREIAPIYELDAFTITLDLKALDGADSAGEIFRLNKSLVLKVVKDGGFIFELTNTEGKTFDLRTAPTKALDGKWHEVSITYDKWTGSLALALDGAEAGSMAANGSTKPPEFWGLNFGSIWGKTAFDGLIGGFTIRDEVQDGIVSPAPPPDKAPAPEPEPDPEPAPAPEPDRAETPDAEGQVVQRWNAGPSTIEATDGGPNWASDPDAVTGAAKLFQGVLASSGKLDASVPGTTPKSIFTHEYWGSNPDNPMGLEFGEGKLADGAYAVRLYMGNDWSGTADPGERIFDVSVEGEIFLDDLDLSDELGHLVGGMFEWRGTVEDGTIDIEFDHVVQNPLINGVEILRLEEDALL